MKTKFALSLFFVISIFTVFKASAWVEPKQGEEIPAVLNTSSDGQEKKGWLNINNWIRVVTNPFSFDVGVESPKFCIKKPDGTQSCCPPQSGQDWSACGEKTGGDGGGKWIWNSRGTVGSFDLIANDPNGIQIPLNDVCSCYSNGVFKGKLPKALITREGLWSMASSHGLMQYWGISFTKGVFYNPNDRGYKPVQYCYEMCQLTEQQVAGSLYY